MSIGKARYIDWYKYMLDPCGFDPPYTDVYDPAKNFYWKDCITETLFYIPWHKVKEINVKALAYMKEDLNDKIDDISRYLCGYAMEQLVDNPDIMIFPHLPYLSLPKKNYGECPVLPRISDVVAIRTALLYAFCGGKGLSDNDKIRLRRYGLLKDIGLYTGQAYADDVCWHELDDICRQIDEFLQGLPIKGEALPEFDVVKGSSVKIKQYYLETNKLQNIRGASMILDEIVRNIIPNKVAQKHIPESFICSGGGNIYLIVPRGYGSDMARLIEQVFEDYTLTAQAVAISKPFKLQDLAQGDPYEKAALDLERAKVLRQRNKMDWRANPPVTEAIAQRALKLHTLFDKYSPSTDYDKETDLCDHCRIRIAAYRRRGGDEEKLCPSCANRTAIGNEGKSYFIKEYESFCRSHSIFLNAVSQPQSVNDIGDKSGYVAVLYGDGNNMGNVVSKMESLTMLRYFSMKVDATTKTAVFKAVGEVIGEQPIEFVSLGGDDMMMILPASHAMDCAIRLGRYFDNGFRNWSTNGNNITMSIGIAISHTKTSIQQLSDISHDLLDSAKRRAQHLVDIGQPSGTVDIAVMESFSTFSTDIEDYREKTLIKKRNYGRGIINSLMPPVSSDDAVCYLSMRPYTWDEAEGLLRAINALKKEATMAGIVHDMRRAVISMSLMEAQLYNSYRYSRMRDEQRKAMDEVMRLLQKYAKASMPIWSLLVKGDGNDKRIYSPFADLMELWDYAEMKEGGMDGKDIADC